MPPRKKSLEGTPVDDDFDEEDEMHEDGKKSTCVSSGIWRHICCDCYCCLLLTLI
jgi:hypothetical protein